jgi:hypothetical protein
MKHRTLRNKDNEPMPDVTIIYWRNACSGLVGREYNKIQLPERFEQTIDRCDEIQCRRLNEYECSGMRGATLMRWTVKTPPWLRRNRAP